MNVVKALRPLCAASVFAAALAGPALGAPVFMKFDGVDGEFQVDSHQLGQLEQKVQQAAPRGGSNIGLNPSSLNFTKHVDKASPKLMEAMTKGRHFPRVELHVRKAGGSQPYLTYKLENVQITSYQLGAAGGAAPGDSFSINFSKISADYKPQGSPRDPASNLQSAPPVNRNP